MDSPTTPAPREGLPWENRSRIGFFAATAATVKEVLLDPAHAFKKMRRDNGLGDPLLYGLLLGTLGGWCALAWQAVLSFVAPALTGEISEMLETTLALVLFAVLVPAMLLFSLFIVTAVVHLLLLMIGGGGAGFAATFRVVAYAHGSTAVLQVVPIFGGMAAFVWSLIASILGLVEVHETTGVKASVAVLLPLGLCCLCLCVGVGLAVFTAALGMQTRM